MKCTRIGHRLNIHIIRRWNSTSTSTNPNLEKWLSVVNRLRNIDSKQRPSSFNNTNRPQGFRGTATAQRQKKTNHSAGDNNSIPVLDRSFRESTSSRDPFSSGPAAHRSAVKKTRNQTSAVDGLMSTLSRSARHSKNPLSENEFDLMSNTDDTDELPFLSSSKPETETPKDVDPNPTEESEPLPDFSQTKQLLQSVMTLSDNITAELQNEKASTRKRFHSILLQTTKLIQELENPPKRKRKKSAKLSMPKPPNMKFQKKQVAEFYDVATNELTPEMISTFRVKDLKFHLKAEGLPVKGRKKELVTRLKEHINKQNQENQHAGAISSVNSVPTPTNNDQTTDENEHDYSSSLSDLNTDLDTDLEIKLDETLISEEPLDLNVSDDLFDTISIDVSDDFSRSS